MPPLLTPGGGGGAVVFGSENENALALVLCGNETAACGGCGLPNANPADDAVAVVAAGVADEDCGAKENADDPLAAPVPVLKLNADCAGALAGWLGVLVGVTGLGLTNENGVDPGALDAAAAAGLVNENEAGPGAAAEGLAAGLPNSPVAGVLVAVPNAAVGAVVLAGVNEKADEGATEAAPLNEKPLLLDDDVAAGCCAVGGGAKLKGLGAGVAGTADDWAGAAGAMAGVGG